MCGILGMYGDDTNVTPKSKEAFALEGAVVNSIRGYDSTGMALLPRYKGDHVRVYKKAMAGYEYICMKPANKLVGELSKSFGLLIHNRAMTRGAVHDSTAHPFTFGNITLVHNGTVQNAINLGKEWNSDCSVDSEHVTWAFNKYGASNILPKLEGGYSLVWWDESDRSLHFARNDLKPMYWAFAHKQQMLYFGSELEMLMLLARRNDILLADKMYSTTPMAHYILKDPKNVRSFTKTEYKQEKKHYPALSHVTNPPYNPPNSGKWTPSSAGSPPGISTTNSNSNTPTGMLGHPCEELIISAADAEKLNYEEMSQEDNRAFHEIASVCGLTSVSPFLATPYAWKAYSDGGLKGIMYCRTTNGRNPLMVIGVSVGDWNRYTVPESGKRRVVLNLQNAMDMKHLRGTGNPCAQVFIANVDRDMTEKYLKGGTESKKELPREVEIGTSRKRRVTGEKFLDLVQGGCVECRDALGPEDARDITWVGDDDDQPLCYHCGNDMGVIGKFCQVM